MHGQAIEMVNVVAVSEDTSQCRTINPREDFHRFARQSGRHQSVCSRPWSKLLKSAPAVRRSIGLEATTTAGLVVTVSIAGLVFVVLASGFIAATAFVGVWLVAAATSGCCDCGRTDFGASDK